MRINHAMGLLAGIAAAGAFAEGGAEAAALHPVKLLCEYRQNPLGLDTSLPRFCWILEAAGRSQTQTAYQILVSDDEAGLNKDHAALWDSGKIPSAQSIHIEYAGKPLQSRQRAWWKVRVWDKNGKVGAWSKPAFWEMGLLNKADWQASWIGLPDGLAAANTQPHNGYHSEVAHTAETEKWVQIDLGQPREFDSVQLFPARSFDYARDIPGTFFPVRFRVEAADNPAFNDAKIVLDKTGEDVGNPAFAAPAYPFAPVTARYVRLTATKLREREPGEFALALAELEVLHGSQNISLHAPATALDSIEHNAWSTHNLTDGDTLSHNGTEVSPAAYLRRTFAVNSKIKKARIYASALGLYELTLNGKKVSDDVFNPGWTDYHKRIQYQTFDVTGLLKTGDNVLGTVLGEGWYSGHIAWAGRKNYGPAPRALAQLEIEHEDGKTEIITTNADWQAHVGPIVANDLLMGETYDARKEINGWNTAAYDAKTWPAALAEPLHDVPLVASPCEPAQKVLELKAKSLTEKNGPAYLYDMGQNMVGHVRIKLAAPGGTTVRLRFGEMLNPDGTLYVANLRSAKATDYYTFKGEGTEVYEPRFTFHGFRYVELTGLPAKPDLSAVTGVVVSSAIHQTGTFACSNPMVNKLQSNIVWGMRGNYLEVPTDCPQRDERLGWMGDAQIFARTACANFDVATFLTKFTQDIRDAQGKEGGYSDVSPRVGDNSDGAPAWADAGIIVPWTVYLAYGDVRLLANHYESMKAYIHYIDSANPDHLWNQRRNNDFGDWLNIGADLPRDVIGTAYFAYSTAIVAKTAKILGKDDEAKQYNALFEQIKDAFNAAYVARDGRIKGDTQTGTLLALHFDLLDPVMRPLAEQHLVSNIVDKCNGHLSTGFVGVGYLNPTLTETGHTDVAFRLLNNDTFPSWGYSIKHGATTIWERWDGWTEEKGFQDVGMNSFNHYSLGSVGEWMMSSVAGIDLDPKTPGYKHILLNPHPGGGLTYARATYQSLFGPIVSDWKTTGNEFVWNVTIPANTMATVTIPVRNDANILESGRPVTGSPDIKFLHNSADGPVYAVGSGVYHFTAPLAP